VYSFGDRILGELAEKGTLSDQSRAHHRNLLLAGSLSIVIAELNLVPTRISALGVDLESSDRHGIRVALLITVGYFLAAFLTYAIPDYLRWQAGHRAAAEMGTTIRGSVQTFADEMDAQAPKIKDDQESRVQYDEARRHMLDAQRRTTFYAVLVPMDWIRATLDFLVPTAVAITAITTLTYGLT
jgi:hypothetical protein